MPITLALAAALKKATIDRPGDAPLLRKRDGSAWQATNTSDHRDLFRRAVERAGLNALGQERASERGIRRGGGEEPRPENDLCLVLRGSRDTREHGGNLLPAAFTTTAILFFSLSGE